MVALNVADGTVKWKHDFAQPAYGAATVSNDLVFTTTFEGKLTALDRDDRRRRLGEADARRHERDGRDRRGHADHRGELPAEQGPEAA